MSRPDNTRSQAIAAAPAGGGVLDEFDPLPMLEVDAPLAWDNYYNRRFGFWLGDLGVLSDPHTVFEIFQSVPISPVPNAPPWLMGVFSLRGFLLPVFDIELFLNRSTTVAEIPAVGIGEHGRSSGSGTREARNIIAVGEKCELAGFIVRDIPAAVQIEDSTPGAAKMPPIPSALHVAFQDFFDIDGKIWCRVDFAMLFRVLGEQAANQMSAQLNGGDC